MSLYAIQDGKIVDATSGRVMDLAEEERWLDRKDLHPEPRDAMVRMVNRVVRESAYQSRNPR